MPHGAGYAPALASGAAAVVDHRRSARPEFAVIFVAYLHLRLMLPAMGCDAAQQRGLAQTIARSQPEMVVSGTPTDPARRIAPARPILHVRYDFVELERPRLGERVDAFLGRKELPYRPAAPR